MTSDSGTQAFLLKLCHAESFRARYLLFC
ncbi:protein of unknown function [Methylorubrum extorquens]|uniref:Uncharacterized protein n=1 Tax=Methylorubrum extorquens TaxID=408 RepID=A0A2N9AWB0_METEX|nr:protein of unknown function [Methylorubrum extorquens]